MDTLFRPAVHLRCLRHTHRTRILGVRSLTTATKTTSTRPPPSTAPAITTATGTKDRNGSTSSKKVVNSNGPALMTLKPKTLHAYSTSPAPTAAQLVHSNAFFTSPPNHLWTAAYFRQFPASAHPEVAFLGRSNVGKSSLLNALFNRPRARTAHVSKKPGRTKTMNAFGVGPERVDIAKETASWKSLGRGGVVVVDMPGYGKGSREVWGVEIMKYLEKRKQLRKTFLLVDVEHGLKETDVQLLRHLRKEGIQHQIILSKADKILYPSAKPPTPLKLHNCLVKLAQRVHEIKAEIEQPNADILCVSAEKDLFMEGMPKAGRLGIDAVRWAVLKACGLDCDEQGVPRKYEPLFVAPPEVELEKVPEEQEVMPMRTSRVEKEEQQEEEEELVSFSPRY